MRREIEREVSRALHHLIKDNGVAPADIAVLMGSARACPLRKGQRIGAFETTRDQAAEPSKVLLETVRRFKGLERPVIILTGIDDLPAAEETALLYCGLSRARVHLVIVATEATMERVCGVRQKISTRRQLQDRRAKRRPFAPRPGRSPAHGRGWVRAGCSTRLGSTPATQRIRGAAGPG